MGASAAAGTRREHAAVEWSSIGLKEKGRSTYHLANSPPLHVLDHVYFLYFSAYFLGALNGSNCIMYSSRIVVVYSLSLPLKEIYFHSV